MSKVITAVVIIYALLAYGTSPGIRYAILDDHKPLERHMIAVYSLAWPITLMMLIVSALWKAADR